MKREVIEFLPQFIKDVVEAYEEVEGVSPEMTLPIILAILSFACQAILDANPHQSTWTRSPLSLFVAIVAESGQRKSATFDSLKQGIVKWQEERVVQAKQDITEYKVEKLQYEAEIKSRAKSEDDFSNDPLYEPQLPRNWKHLLEKFTTNGLLKELERLPHAFIVNTDAAEFFNSHAFQGKGSDIEITSVLAKLWSGESVEKNTGIEDKYVANRRVSALFMIQAGQAKFLKDARYKDQGFTNRVLISQPPLIKKKKKKSMFDTSNDESKAKLNKAIDVFNERVYDLLKSSENSGKSKLADLRQALVDTKDKNELALDVVQIDKEAQAVYEEVDDSLDTVKETKYYKKPGFYEEYQQFIDREFEHFIRLATVLAVSQFKDSIGIEDAWCGKMLKDEFVDQRQHLELDIVQDKGIIVTVAEDLWKQLDKWTNYPDAIPEKARELIKEKGGYTKTIMNNYCIKSYATLVGSDKDKVLQEMLTRDWIVMKELEKGGKIITVCSS